MNRTAVVVVATGVGLVNETEQLGIGAYILEHHTSQLTEHSLEINTIHDPENQL